MSRYKYLHKDFAKLPVFLDHCTIFINFQPHNQVHVTNTMRLRAKDTLSSIVLNAKNLKIESVEWVEHDAADGTMLEHEYDTENNHLIIQIPTVKTGEEFSIRIRNICEPSDHILEGIYKDVTPKDAPQQYMSQCQQWGFQRITPIFDDCRAKCTYTTTIEADARYTHLISNGNIDRSLHPDGRPMLTPQDPARQMITYRNEVPMAPYLFCICVGTWDVLDDGITLPTGKHVKLEYLVPKGHVNDVKIPMRILKDSIQWVFRTQDYEYSHDTYRTICMSKSNFGGMENVGNTTIVTDAALIDEHTTDQSLIYAHSVIVHEFEHNQCGSETTMESPFDLWLNEAFTVDVERQYVQEIFDKDIIRLDQIDTIRHPLIGPLAIEDSGRAGRIVREGFNDPDELIDSVTYVKAAEVIRMLRLILGDDKFKEGKTLYFRRYHGGNANTDQFFACFEEVSGTDLAQFKQEWLHRIGYPKVQTSESYDEESRTYTISIEQDKKPFHFPLTIALIDEDGNDMVEQTIEVKETVQEIKIHDIDRPSFASLNRGSSFYGIIHNKSQDNKTLAMQARYDPNIFNRVDAMRRLTDIERVALMEDEHHQISEVWLSTYAKTLLDQEISDPIKAYMLRIDETPLNREYLTWYPEMVRAREQLALKVYDEFHESLLSSFESIDTYATAPSLQEGIMRRMLKNTLLSLLAVDDNPQVHDMIIAHYLKATTAQDRVSALALLNRSSSDQRHAILEQVYEKWHSHLSGYANYLRIIASGTNKDVFEMIQAEQERETFDIKQPTWSRALFLPLAVNNKVLWTEQGIVWMRDKIIELAPINMTTTTRLLNAFQFASRLKEPLQQMVIAALTEITVQIPKDVQPTIHEQARTYLGK